jgi:hypothetical protein
MFYAKKPFIAAALMISLFAAVALFFMHPERPTLGDTLKTAGDIAVYRGYPLSSAKTQLFHIPSNSKLLLLFKGAIRFHSQREGIKPNITFMVWCRLDSPPRLYGYSSRTGEMGSDHEWCYMPDDFKNKMQLLLENSDHEPVRSHISVKKIDGVVIAN